MLEKLEILSLEIFRTHEMEMIHVENMKRELNWQIGWHYHLDLAWMLREISRLPPGALILDAGAGRGLAQFLLAAHGYNVISVDVANRLSVLRKVKQFGSEVYNLNETENYRDLKLSNAINRITVFFGNKRVFGEMLQERALACVARNRYRPSEHNAMNVRLQESAECGRVFIYKSDLKHMELLPDNYVDGVISISALEHNSHQDLRHCMDELMRVTNPGGLFVITVSASQSEDWFHKPSKGWCYSESSLRDLFQLSDDTDSNFDRKDEFMSSLKRKGNELHKRLDSMYFQSGDNGMPWGKWDPRYQPVGIVKHKPVS